MCSVSARQERRPEIEFGNKLWLGETSEGYIVDYVLEAQQTGDARHVLPAIVRLFPPVA